MEVFNVKILSFFCGCLAVGLGLLSIPGCSSNKDVPLASNEGIQTLRAWQVQVEGYASQLKAIYPRDSDQYKEAERRYIGAEVKAETWKDRMLFALALGSDIAASERSQAALEVAYAKTKAFVNYVNGVLEPSNPAQAPSLMELGALKEASLKISQEYRNSLKARQEQIRAEIAKWRWKTFSEI